MFVLGHLGIGKRISTPFLYYRDGKILPIKFFIFGALFPDIVDKFIYYGLKFFDILGVVTSTRSFAHSFLFLLIIFLVSFLRRSDSWLAFTLGCLSHVFLDHFGEILFVSLTQEDREFNIYEKMRIQGLMWPFLGNVFPYFPHENLTDHLGSVMGRLNVIVCEFLGGFFLYQDFRGRLGRRG